ncbi:TetR/AcrR family transcriptional regulator [Flindersiella endophytica]
MTTEYSGTGDPERTLALLWRKLPLPSRGPKPKLTVDQIVRAAISVADAEGLTALSMRRVAAELGVGVMSLYTYVPSKAELLEVMLDEVIGEPDRPGPEGGDWRSRLEAAARAEWRMYQRHPWVLQVSTVRPPLGPGVMRAYEDLLATIDGVGLDELQMFRIANLVSDYVKGAARSAVEWTLAEQSTGLSHDEWWLARVPFIESYAEGDYPVSSRLAEAELYIPDPAGDFDFGLQRLLAGIEQLIESQTDV